MRLIGVLAFVLGLLVASSATAGPTSVECLDDPNQCGWTATVDGVEVANGTFVVDPATGDFGMSGGPFSVETADYKVDVGPITGNIDPEIVFGLGATNTSSGPLVFAFAFSLPLGGFSVPISTEAALAITLTAGSASDGHVTPTGAKIVDSQDIVVVPFSSVDKGVDIGDPLTDPAGGLASISNTLTAGSILAGGPFDVMSVVISFVLVDDAQLAGSAGSVGVGMSGRVTQVPLPEPALGLLLGAGLAGLALLRRRA